MQASTQSETNLLTLRPHTEFNNEDTRIQKTHLYRVQLHLTFTH